MNTQDELMVWRDAWQSEPVVPIDLIQRVERQTAQMRTLRMAESLVTIAMGGAVLAGAIVQPFLDRIYWLLLAAGTWLFIAAGWFVSVRSRRRAWEVVEPTTAAYLSLHVERLQRQVERAPSGTVLSVLLGVFVLGVVYEALAQMLAAHGVRLTASDLAPFTIAGGAVILFVILGQISRRRRARAELARMLELKRKVEELSR
jgi:hypothetical protein